MTGLGPLRLELSRSEGLFELRVVNEGAESVWIWSDSCSMGYDSVHFLVSSHGRTGEIRRKPAVWSVNIPATEEIKAHQHYSVRLDLRDGTWDLGGLDALHPGEVAVAAIMEIGAGDLAARYGVLTGRFESNRLRFESADDILRGTG